MSKNFTGSRAARGLQIAAAAFAFSFAGAAPATAQVIIVDPTVSKVVQDALKTSITTTEFIIAESALVSSSTIAAVGCDIANFAIGKALPANVPGPFNAACGTVQSGAGYYMFGNSGPGGVKPFNRFTAYIPTKNVGCTVREYKFTFSVNGPNTFSKVANGVTDQFAAGGMLDQYATKMGTPLAVQAWRALYNAVGDFAIVLAINPGTKGVYVYVLAANTAKLESTANNDAAAISTLSTAVSQLGISSAVVSAVGTGKVYANAVANALLYLKGQMAGSTEGYAAPNLLNVRRGSSIQDQFAGSCYSPLLFYYMVGTASITFN